jgi:hypothetical protein
MKNSPTTTRKICCAGACERIVAESPDRAERRAAAAQISQILRQAETISA